MDKIKEDSDQGSYITSNESFQLIPLVFDNFHLSPNQIPDDDVIHFIQRYFFFFYYYHYYYYFLFLN